MGAARAEESLTAHALVVRQHMADSELKGWDPYDGLTSPLFRLPILHSNWLIRFGAQQVILRSPVNLRPLLRTPKQLNAVTIGLYLRGLSDLVEAEALDAASFADEVNGYVTVLSGLRSEGWSGTCWGYPFPWEGRRGAHRTPANFPTVVATGMIVNGLHRAWRVFGNQEAREMVVDSANFVLNDLQRVAEDDSGWCWSYSPADSQSVPNATMKGSRLIAQAVDAGFDNSALDAAFSSARWAAQQQQADGGWAYAVAGDPRSWRDQFHTGYILECFASLKELTGVGNFDSTISRGWEHYRSTFFTPDSLPKYYDSTEAPLDPTAAGQALITLSQFGDVSYAEKVADAVNGRLANADGSFRYRPSGSHGRSGNIEYMRWSTAWMFAGMAQLILAGRNRPTSGD